MICPYCRTQLLITDKTTECVQCGAWHHSACWKEYGRCAVFGCRGVAISRRKQVLQLVPALLLTIAMLNAGAFLIVSPFLVAFMLYCAFSIAHSGAAVVVECGLGRNMARERLKKALLQFLLNLLPIVLSILRR